MYIARRYSFRNGNRLQLTIRWKPKCYPIYIEVNNGTDLTAQAPTFELTPGATINPASGTTHNFTKPVRYTTTSEDGKWHRTYAISLHYPSTTNIPTSFHFETVKKVSNYYVFYEEAPGHATLTWASGNQGFALTGGGNSPEEYPTTIAQKDVPAIVWSWWLILPET